MNLAILKPVNKSGSCPSDLAGTLKYIADPKKTRDGKLVWGKDCSPDMAYQQMMATKRIFHKTGGRQCIHIIHSFHDDDPVTEEMAMEIGQKFLTQSSQFKDFEVLMAVHTNEDHLHIHYTANSVSYKDGRKWQCGPKDLEKMRSHSDELCREYGLSVIENRGNFNMHYGEYNNLYSWKHKLALDVRQCLTISRSWEEFADELKNVGIDLEILPPNFGDYTVVFQVSEEYCGQKDGRQCSSNKLSNYGDFSYQNMSRILEFNALNEISEDWDNDVLSSFLETFDDTGEFHTLSMNYDIEWKSLCWLEIQLIIGQMKARQKANQASNQIIREKNASKERMNLLLTCSEEWLDYFRGMQEQEMEDDWYR